MYSTHYPLRRDEVRAKRADKERSSSFLFAPLMWNQTPDSLSLGSFFFLLLSSTTTADAAAQLWNWLLLFCPDKIRKGVDSRRSLLVGCCCSHGESSRESPPFFAIQLESFRVFSSLGFFCFVAEQSTRDSSRWLVLRLLQTDVDCSLLGFFSLRLNWRLLPSSSSSIVSADS